MPRGAEWRARWGLLWRARSGRALMVAGGLLVLGTVAAVEQGPCQGGASLPLLLLFKGAGINFTDAINNQDVAESIVATLVGAIGVVASVPLTTALATLLARDLPADAVPADAHGHHH